MAAGQQGHDSHATSAPPHCQEAHVDNCATVNCLCFVDWGLCLSSTALLDLLLLCFKCLYSLQGLAPCCDPAGADRSRGFFVCGYQGFAFNAYARLQEAKDCIYVLDTWFIALREIVGEFFAGSLLIFLLDEYIEFILCLHVETLFLI